MHRARGVDNLKAEWQELPNRQEHAMAYAKWTTEEDDRLRQLFSVGRTIDELAAEFRRNRGAIKLRIGKLNLVR